MGVKFAEQFARELDPEEVFKFLAKAQQHPMTQEEIAALKRNAFVHLAQRDPAQALLQATTEPRFSLDERKAAAGQLSLALPRDQSTADLLMQLADQSATGTALGTTLSYWAGKDPVGAAEWLKQYLPHPQEERMTRPIVQKWVHGAIHCWDNPLNPKPVFIPPPVGFWRIGLKFFQHFLSEDWKDIAPAHTRTSPLTPEIIRPPRGNLPPANPA